MRIIKCLTFFIDFIKKCVMTDKSKKMQDEKPIEVTYPHYLSNKPQGVDLFKGRSQELLSEAMASHIRAVDSVKESNVPRLIGLEGRWGSGKSNVIKLLQSALSDKYFFFCFDAWGNQEDLQRRSILELLTKDLITEKKLTGLTKMLVMKTSGDGRVITDDCTWDEKLESLLSRKSFSKNITVPSVNNSTKWFVLSLLFIGIIVAYLSVNKTGIWWADILIALSPLILFTIGMVVTGSSWRKMFSMYNTDSRSNTTSYVINEQEPSVREFRDWMDEISRGIPKDEKLVLVFDNMDRLPADKVHQFWSLFQTFFADSGFKNIWCIVPYDVEHLAAAFTTEDNDEKSKSKLLNGYLAKTFPIVYRVPEPIEDDYKHIFKKLYESAFGPTIDKNSFNIISRCYRHVRTKPNVRDIVSFINDSVLITNQWNGKIHPISIAIYLLKKDTILRHPAIETKDEKGNSQYKDVSTDEYILNHEYYNGLQQILYEHEANEYLPSEIAALVYGIAPNEALQIVIKRYLHNCFTGVEKNPVINSYVDNPRFITMLEETVNKLEPESYDSAVKLIDQIDKEKLNDEDKAGLENVWSILGDSYARKKMVTAEFMEYEKILFSHLTPVLAEKCAKAFCSRLADNNDVKGNALYVNVKKLFDCEFASKFEVNKVCKARELQATRFLDYVQEAGADYIRYPFFAKPEDINKALIESIGEEFDYYVALECLKHDEKYSVDAVGKYATEKLRQEDAHAQLAYNLICIQQIFYEKFQNKLDVGYVQKLWQEVQSDKNKPAYDEIYVLKALTSFDQIVDDERHTELILLKWQFYITTEQLLKDIAADKVTNCRISAAKRMIQEKEHDGTPTYSEFIEKWSKLCSAISVSKEALVEFADSWGVKDIPEGEKSKGYFELLSDVSWIDVLLASETPIAKVLLKKCVSEMITKDVSQFLQPNTAAHAGNSWSKAFQKLINTEYLDEKDFGTLNDVAASLLDYYAQNGPVNDVAWDGLLGKVQFTTISTQVNEIRSKILRGDSRYDINAAKFKCLHEWLEKAEINTSEHCTDSANHILEKVINDAECQGVILNKKEYYRPILANTKGTASKLHEKLKKILKDTPDSDFAKYIAEIVGDKDTEEKGGVETADEAAFSTESVSSMSTKDT